MSTTLESLRTQLLKFVEDRDWNQFHSPKNLVMALAGETGELIEHFQWLTEEQSKHIPLDKMQPVADEIADIQLYLIMIADKLGVDIFAECERKIAKNAAKYPVDKARGRSNKYDTL